MPNYSQNDYKKMLQNEQISSKILETLLKAREEKIIDFKLIDIREIYEYTDASIKGTDILLPTSAMHLHMNLLEEQKNEHIILYCRTGNRTGHVMMILKRMGFAKISHLTYGIMDYRGEILRGAPLPNKL